VENLHVKIEQVEGGVLTIREGQAMPLVPPKRIEITGDINTVSSFIKARSGVDETAGQQFINRHRAVVTVNKDKRTITLELDPQDANGTVVTAKLESNPDLDQFFINKNKQFSQKELVSLLKFSRLYFEDFGKHGELLKAYTSFSAKTYTDLSGESDSRGNKNFAFNKKVETGLPTAFVMNLPIFKGQDAKRFMVEICFDVTDNAASFWFESVDLAEQQDIETSKILDVELKECSGFVVIHK
jgi:hypothetical protein